MVVLTWNDLYHSFVHIKEREYLVRLRNAFIITAIAVSTLAGLNLKASADPVTFAQFTQGGGGNAFVFTNNGADSILTVVNVPVNFSYQTDNCYGAVGQNILANMTLTASVSDAGNLTGKNISQSFTVNSMVFTAVNPINGNSNLLTLQNGSTGVFTGLKGSHVGSLYGDTDNGDTVQFTSDFLSFDQTIERNFSLSFTSLNPSLQLSANNFLSSFTAAGTGTFDSDPVPTLVPEPSSIVFWMIGGICIAGTLTIRKRRASADVK